MLKKIAFILITGLFVTVSMFAQDSQEVVVPKRVKNKMLALYPQTQEVPVTWSKDGANYMGSLTIMDKPAGVLFDSTGNVLYTEKRIHQTYLPKPILAQLKAQDPNFGVKEIFEYTDAAGKKTYKTVCQMVITTKYNADGTIIKEK